MHRHFSENYHNTLNISKHIVKIEEILFILHVVNGIYIIIHNADKRSIFTLIQLQIIEHFILILVHMPNVFENNTIKVYV